MNRLSYSAIARSLRPLAIVPGDRLLFGSVIAIGGNQPIRATPAIPTRQITDDKPRRNVTVFLRQAPVRTRQALHCRAVLPQSP
jgi:hypothetical protein